MASIYPRGGIWWLKYRARSGKIVRESTGYRVGSGNEKRKAQELRAKMAFEESKARPANRQEAWDIWVGAFIRGRYPNANSFTRYSCAWRTVRIYLEEKRIAVPRELTRQHCLGYLDWRKAHHRKVGKFKAGKNTAILELKFLGLVMKEAVNRGLANANPCRELRLKAEPSREKAAFDLDALALIERGIEAMPDGGIKEFFSHSYQIARYQGCRLNETFLNPLADVDIFDGGGGVIRFRAKGGRIHAAPLHPALRPLFLKLKKAGRTETYQRPKCPAREWFNFFHRIGIKRIDPSLCFHSFRVLVATELARMNVHEPKARRYLGHASTTVHRIYQRLSVADVADVVSAISSGKPQSRQK